MSPHTDMLYSLVGNHVAESAPCGLIHDRPAAEALPVSVCTAST